MQNFIGEEDLKKSKNSQVFNLTFFLVFFSLIYSDLGDSIFGVNVGTNVSTLLIIITFIIQIITKTLHFPKILFVLYLYIMFQTYILNPSNLFSPQILFHLLGLIIFSLSFFSFISEYRNRIVYIVRAYYNLVFIIICFTIIQLLVFVVFGLTIRPNINFSPILVSGNIGLIPHFWGIPRAMGLSTEPAHFAAFAIPGVYIAISILFNSPNNLGLKNMNKAVIILIGFIFSFSIVAYFGLILALFANVITNFKINRFRIIILLFFFLGLFSVIGKTKIGQKFNDFIIISKDITNRKYTTNDLSSFAIFSNLIVAKESLKNSYFTGTGLNTHFLNYDKYIYTKFRKDQVLMELNTTGGGSLFIRLLSEFGLPGILFIFYFLWHYRLNKGIAHNTIKTINNMSLVVLLTIMIRSGVYLSNVLMFFMAIYYYSSILNTSPSIEMKIISGDKI